MRAEREEDRNIAMAKEYFVRGDAGRADLLELFHPEFQLYFPSLESSAARKPSRNWSRALPANSSPSSMISASTISSLPDRMLSSRARRAAQ